MLLVNIGYLGHMWELYAMWAWLLTYARAALEVQGQPSPAFASLLTFCAIAAGVAGCLLGGVLSDRFGRSLTTAGMMIVSGLCALAIGFVFDGPLWLFVLVALVWGISVVGDSAQFSAAVTELGNRRFVGTALSVQLGLGFALTVLVIGLIPRVAGLLGGWRWAFLLLVPGPLIGAAAMLGLRRLPSSTKMAGGKPHPLEIRYGEVAASGSPRGESGVELPWMPVLLPRMTPFDKTGWRLVKSA